MAELSDRYARALLELSIERGTTDQSVEQAAFVRDALKAEGAADFLAHPSIPDGAKIQLVEALFAGRVSGDLMGFLRLAIEKSREALVPQALNAFIDMADSYRGRTSATVVSAVALSPAQLEKLRALLAGKLDKEVELVNRVDPAVIGGLFVHAEGRLMDWTVRTRLKNMRENFRRGVSHDRKAR